jgi:hypothetical protein
MRGRWGKGEVTGRIEAPPHAEKAEQREGSRITTAPIIFALALLGVWDLKAEPKAMINSL